jgi:hypothetical protein
MQEQKLSSYIDVKKTQQFIGELLKDGTPDEFRFPNDYKSYRDECAQADREYSNEKAKAHRMEDQDILTDEESSLVNFINVNQFIGKLRENGIKCGVYQDPQSPQTCGLYAVRPGYEMKGFQFVTSMQVPVMPEWALLHDEDHGIPNGEAAIGWRQVLVKLVTTRIVSEQRIHEIFGEPRHTRRSNRYRRTLHAFRNGKIPDEIQ